MLKLHSCFSVEHGFVEGATKQRQILTDAQEAATNIITRAEWMWYQYNISNKISGISLSMIAISNPWETPHFDELQNARESQCQIPFFIGSPEVINDSIQSEHKKVGHRDLQEVSLFCSCVYKGCIIILCQLQMQDHQRCPMLWSCTSREHTLVRQV